MTLAERPPETCGRNRDRGKSSLRTIPVENHESAFSRVMLLFRRRPRPCVDDGRPCSRGIQRAQRSARRACTPSSGPYSGILVSDANFSMGHLNLNNKSSFFAMDIFSIFDLFFKIINSSHHKSTSNYLVYQSMV